MKPVRAFATLAFALISFSAFAADYPAPKQAEWVARDFKFHTGEVLPELRMSYTTVGEPTGQPVLVLHGTTGNAGSMLTPAFAGELFGAGQPLDATKYFIIIPDSVGHGKSAKPSDGLKTKFPKYNYDDMVDAQYRLLSEGLGIKRLRLIIGNSMGGMHAWIWGAKYPRYMDALAPMASQPTAMASRNWMMRRLLIETIRNDPGLQQRRLHRAAALAQDRQLPCTRSARTAARSPCRSRRRRSAQADKFVDERLAAPLNVDANNYLYAWESSRDYDPAPGLEKIEAAVLAINAADDERNPPETGITDAALKRVKNAQLLLIPASEATRGHGTTAFAKFYAKELAEFLQKVPQRGM